MQRTIASPHISLTVATPSTSRECSQASCTSIVRYQEAPKRFKRAMKQFQSRLTFDRPMNELLYRLHEHMESEYKWEKVEKNNGNISTRCKERVGTAVTCLVPRAQIVFILEPRVPPMSSGLRLLLRVPRLTRMGMDVIASGGLMRALCRIDMGVTHTKNPSLAYVSIHIVSSPSAQRGCQNVFAKTKSPKDARRESVFLPRADVSTAFRSSRQPLYEGRARRKGVITNDISQPPWRRAWRGLPIAHFPS